jgi:septal ring factor EnvC (AmiA/AmiB activator)
LYQEKKNAISEVRVSLENTLAVLTESIRVTTESIATTSADIIVRQDRIAELERSGLVLRARIREHRAIILAYLKNIYSEGNSILDTTGNIDLIKSMILTTEDSDFVLSDITYKTLITQM